MRQKPIILSLVIILFLSIYPTTTISDPDAESEGFNTFTNNILLSTEDGQYPQHVEPTLAISNNGTLFAGWKQSTSHNGGGIRVSFTKSNDGGASWSTPFDMPKFQGLNTGQSDPWLVWHNGSLYYTYLEYLMEANLGETFSQITVAKSQDYGETWNPVTATYGDGFADKEIMTISSSGDIYVAYDDINISSDQITVRVSRSTDQGMTFSEVGTVTDSVNHPVDHLSPYITTDSQGNVYVVWIWYTTDNYWGDIYLAVSEDRGETFSDGSDINPNDQNASITIVDDRVSRASLPVLKFHDDRMYVVWCARVEESGGWDVYLRYSDDFGASWSDRFQVNPQTEGDQWQPDFDIDSKGDVHVVWLDEQGSTFRPYYRRITILDQSSNVTFGDPVPIASASTSNTFTRPGDYFAVRLDGNDTPHVVWTDGRENEMDIYYSHGIYIPITTPTPTIFHLFVPVVLLLLVIANKIETRFKD